MVFCARNILAVAGLTLFLGAALAPARAGEDEEHDHERARAAFERGEVLPLSDVLAAVRSQISGEIVGTEFEKEDGLWVYEIKYINNHGRMIELLVDAKTARIIEIEDDE